MAWRRLAAVVERDRGAGRRQFHRVERIDIDADSRDEPQHAGGVERAGAICSSEEEHQRLLDAVLDRDAEQACAILERHFGDTTDRLLKAWEQGGQASPQAPCSRPPARTADKAAPVP